MEKNNPFVFDEKESFVEMERTQSFDEKLRNNFPKSFISRRKVPFTYRVPKSYLEPAFWEQITSKLGQWRRKWLEYQHRLVMVQDENILAKKLALTRKSLEKLTDSYDVLMQLDCSEKENKNSKIPLELWNDLWEELRNKDVRTRNLCSCLSSDLMAHLNFKSFDWPLRKENIVPEKVNIKQEALTVLEGIKTKLKALRNAGPVHEIIVENILKIWNTVTTISADTENQEDMFGILVGLLEKNKDISANEYKTIREGIEELVAECSSMTDTSSYKHLPENFKELIPPKIVPKWEIKKEPQDLSFDVSETRAKRDRKPKKVFSPVYTPPPELDECGEKPEDDEERASSSESSNDSGSEFEANEEEDAESDDQEEFIVEDDLYEPAVKKSRSPDIQAVPKTTEAEMMALEQMLYLEETKLQLMGCRLPNGQWAATYLPFILETIDKATDSLAKKENLVHFIMHRAAIEEGVCRFIEEFKDPEKRKAVV